MEVIKEYWAILSAAAALVVWLVRLEAGMLANRKDVRRLEKQREDDVNRSERHRDRTDEKLDDIRKSIDQVLILLGNKVDR